MQASTRNLAATLGQHLQLHHARVVTAESCTGGAIAAAITSVAGSSAWFEAGFVTYSNAMKTQLLGVPSALITTHGVVSEVVVKAMVAGACEVTTHKATTCGPFGIAVSGVAGPSGGTQAKPVGTVCIAWGQGLAIEAKTFYFTGDRKSICAQAATQALHELVQYLQKLGK